MDELEQHGKAPKDRQVTRSPLWLGAIFSFLPPLAALWIVSRNRSGFDDVEAMIDLAAMVFSAVAVPWVVVAVLLQRSELALQREELRLQRLEIRNLVGETRRQAHLMSDQLRLSTKESLIGEYRSFILSEEERIIEVIEEIGGIIVDISCERAGVNPDEVNITRRYGNARVRVEITNASDGSSQFVPVRYSEIAQRIPENPRIKRGHRFWKQCRSNGLGYWFRSSLPHAAGPLGNISVYKLSSFNGVAARAR